MADSSRITFLERWKITMELVVPLVRVMQEELGDERAKSIVERAMVQYNHHFVESSDVGPDKMAYLATAIEGFAEGALEYEVLRLDETAFEYNVTSCGYARMMEEFGATDIGPTVCCNGDFAMADELGVELKRTQTCMQGASHCDFRWRLKPTD